MLSRVSAVLRASAVASKARALSTATSNVFITAEELAGRREEPVTIIDAGALAAYKRAHIDSARALQAVTGPTLKGDGSPLVVDADTVTRIAAELGIGRTDEVVVYDDVGGVNAARFWWVMSLYGKTNVRVLRDGWLHAVSANVPTTLSRDAAAESFARGMATEDPFVAALQPGWLATVDDVVEAASGQGDVELVDVRTLGEWTGEDVRGGNPRGGHIAGSKHIVHTSLSDGFAFVDNEAARAEVSRAGIDTSKPMVTYCQSGMRAAHTALVLRALGHDRTSVFDGSMFELSRDDRVALQQGRGDTHAWPAGKPR